MQNFSTSTGASLGAKRLSRPSPAAPNPRDAGNSASVRQQRQDRERRGRLAELVACALLTLKGYRIIARRLKAPAGASRGEIDLIALRGQRLAFVEVKQRRDHETAIAALAPHQLHRMETAVENWLWRNPRYRNHRVSLDAVVLDRHLRPRHLIGALHAW